MKQLKSGAFKLFDLYYTQAPIIKNELANKSTPSPQANSALRKLMLRCIENEQQPALGFSDTKNILLNARFIML